MYHYWIIIYFETYGTIPELSVGQTEEKFAALRKAADGTISKESARKRLSVVLLKFVLFLYIQNAPRVSLKSSIVNDQWPSADLERKSKWTEEHSHLLFLTSHLSDIIQLLTDPTKGGPSDSVITEEGVAALDLLIGGSSADKQGVCSVSSLATTPSQVSKSGYSKISCKFSSSLFEVWLKSHLTISPHGIISLRSHDRDSSSIVYKSDGKGRVISNTQLAPCRHQCMLIASLSNQTMALQDDQLCFAHIRVQSCYHSNIYIMAPISSMRLERCINCTLVLGAVQSTVVINKCENVTVVTVCQSLHISSSCHCKFHLCVTHNPLILGGNSHLKFGAHNTSYHQLEDHMRQCGLHSSPNHWNTPTIVGDHEGGVSEVWQLMPADMFSLITVPFQGKSPAKESLCEIPSPYKEEMEKRKMVHNDWFKLVEQANLSDEQAEQLTVKAQAQFQTWLERTGHVRELTTLDPSHQHHVTT
ncbi:TBCC domain-containing protein 1-like isoform X2 [Dysidea avara]|uniref:TBCC domain-containing protein 1-like isoform X2 n=1 Tax=Dysidea avara TaxID=196820 RepID=UPI00332A34C2